MVTPQLPQKVVVVDIQENPAVMQVSAVRAVAEREQVAVPQGIPQAPEVLEELEL